LREAGLRDIATRVYKVDPRREASQVKWYTLSIWGTLRSWGEDNRLVSMMALSGNPRCPFIFLTRDAGTSIIPVPSIVLFR
jgi:hypothetical protein